MTPINLQGAPPQEARRTRTTTLEQSNLGLKYWCSWKEHCRWKYASFINSISAHNVKDFTHMCSKRLYHECDRLSAVKSPTIIPSIDTESTQRSLPKHREQ